MFVWMGWRFHKSAKEAAIACGQVIPIQEGTNDGEGRPLLWKAAMLSPKLLVGSCHQGWAVAGGSTAQKYFTISENLKSAEIVSPAR